MFQSIETAYIYRTIDKIDDTIFVLQIILYHKQQTIQFHRTLDTLFVVFLFTRIYWSMVVFLFFFYFSCVIACVRMCVCVGVYMPCYS